MIYTVEQASKFLCPHFPATTVTSQTDEGTETTVKEFMPCQANKCSAWRWFADEQEKTFIYTKKGELPKDHEQRLLDGWNHTSHLHKVNTDEHIYRRPDPNRRGYCGLAGKPEG